MSVSGLSQSAAENSFAVPRAEPSFAERFYLSAIVANALLIATVSLFSRTPLVFATPPQPLETSTALGLAASLATFAITWIALVSWRQVQHPWTGLVIPLAACGPAFLFATNTDYLLDQSFPLSLSEKVRAILITYALMLGFVAAWGFRLVSQPTLSKTQPAKRVSLKSLLAALVTAVAYGYATRLSGLDNIVRGGEPVLIVTTGEIAVIAFVLTLTGYLGWSLTVLAGVLFHIWSRQLECSLPFFSINDTRCATHYLGTILLFTSAMTLPWLLSGWRIVWTPPLWEKSWRRPKVASGEAA
jgi:hypothetical protein